ncbi:MAG: hypothetical protein E6J20_08415 [Chloroflexi bacterium]|nr:MAG: hypothetical protein E6J20_08415 [Chloroflexota bacterium]
MPKLSVYVSDELWDKARKASGEHNTSQLIQRALELMVERESAGATYKESRPPGSEATLALLRGIYSDQARIHLERGYQAGLNYLTAYRVPWDDFQQLADRDFDLKRWLQPWFSAFLDGVGTKDWNPPKLPDWLVSLGQDYYLGEFAKPIDGDGFYPNRTYLQGFERAMRDVWRSVEYGPEAQQGSDQLPPMEEKAPF